MAAVGENVRRWREYRVYSQAELARRTGITPRALYEIEAGRTQPRPSTARRLAEALDITPAALLGLDPPGPDGHTPDQEANQRT